MAKVTKEDSKTPTLKEKKKVAAYARVSMESERMNHSLSTQVSYYSSLIQSNPDWEYAGVFADEGISGTGIAKRTEFKRMIAAADEGKIDIILTKSIQRFARNTVDFLETVRHLKDIGVEVRFEKEHLNSMSGDGKLMLTILASFAQEESRSISENVKWGTRKRFEKGIPNGRPPIYGYLWQGDQLLIVPEEAEIVKRIYREFMEGTSRIEIGNRLNKQGIFTRRGCQWVDSNVKVILTNITYTGNMILQKNYCESPAKHSKKNNGVLPQYYVENTHEPIIPMDEWQKVQEECQRRKELGVFRNKNQNFYAFTGKIKCPYCGCSYCHATRNKNGNFQEFWECATKRMKKVGNGCPIGGTINQKNLKKACAEVLGQEEFDENVFTEKVDHIEIPEKYMLEIYMKDGAVIRKACPCTGHQDCWTPEYRARASEERRNRKKKKAETQSGENQSNINP